MAVRRQGPAIAISFLLVAVACSFAGLCYAELASMIPIAGSAYTYSYATLGEFIAWIIGWDLILEYVVSNIAVAVGFGGYFKAQLGAFGWNIPDRWSTPVWDDHWTGAYFNVPAFLVVFVLTVLLSSGNTRIGRSQQRNGHGEDRRHSHFFDCGRHVHEPRQFTSIRSFRLSRHHGRRSDYFLHLHRL